MNHSNINQQHAPLPWTPEDAHFSIPEFENLPSEHGQWSQPSPAMLSRHFLFLGETGSGKTRSGIEPVTRALLRYGTQPSDQGKEISALIIDPKHELGAMIERELAGTDRLIRVGDGARQIDFFEDQRDQPLNIKNRLDQLFQAMAPQNQKATKNSDNNFYWNGKGKEAIYTICELAAEIELKGSNLCKEMLDLDNWSEFELPQADMPLVDMISKLLVKQGISIGASGHTSFESADNDLAHLKRQLIFQLKNLPPPVAEEANEWKKFFSAVRAGLKKLGMEVDTALHRVIAIIETHEGRALLKKVWEARGIPCPKPNTLQNVESRIAASTLDNPGNWFAQINNVFSCINALSINGTGSFSRGHTPLPRLMLKIVKKFDLQHLWPRLTWLTTPDDKTLYWICDIATVWVALVSSPVLASRLWLNPVQAPDHVISLSDVVETGKILLYEPSLTISEEEEHLGRTIKRLYFRATFARRNKTRGVAYICDEFQRFVSSDRESGEQSFLDRCRAYRCICVLATQSMASLNYALLSGEMADTKLADSALAVMLNNLGNKFFFRNTDLATQQMLTNLIPSPPVAGPHVLSVRPLSTLRPGECYSLLASGEWGRQQIHLPTPAAVVRSPRAALNHVKKLA